MMNQDRKDDYLERASSSPRNKARREKKVKKEWIFHGNFVVPLHNPFSGSTSKGASRDATSNSIQQPSYIINLGPGLEIRTNHVMKVSSTGIIEHFDHENVEASHEILMSTESSSKVNTEYIKLSEREFVCPGFIDLHIHAPQFAYTGTATDRPLMGPNGWLESYTFPAESSLGTDLTKAQTVYESVVRATLYNGTTTAVYFATLHLEPCKILTDIVLDVGQRALIGKVCMDRNSPEYYCQTIRENLDETLELIRYIHSKAGRENKTCLDSLLMTKVPAITTHPPTTPPTAATSSEVPAVTSTCEHDRNEDELPQEQQNLPLVLPIVTPRFVPTCTPELLHELGQIASRYGCHIQSHISESTDEVEFSRYLDATVDNVTKQEKGNNNNNNNNNKKDDKLDNGTSGVGRTDAVIFDSHQLLTDRTVMAHGVYLTESDMSLMKNRGSSVAHCPLSNFYFAGASLRCRCLMERGNKIGLGTDVAGGYSPSMLDASRMTVVASRSLEHAQRAREEEREKLRIIEKGPPAKKDRERLVKSDSAREGTIEIDNALDYRHAFYLATLGGAEALGLEDHIGTFRVGMEFDGIILSAEDQTHLKGYSPVHVFDSDNVQDIFQKLCTLGDDRNVKRVFVQGVEVKLLDDT